MIFPFVSTPRLKLAVPKKLPEPYPYALIEPLPFIVNLTVDMPKFVVNISNTLVIVELPTFVNLLISSLVDINDPESFWLKNDSGSFISTN